MKKRLIDWIGQPEIKRVLLAFTAPKTPRQVEQELGIAKIKMKLFLDSHLLESLNPGANKGRLYRLTPAASELLDVPSPVIKQNHDWEIIGWIKASPNQRLAVLLSFDTMKRTSEEIRARTRKFSKRLTRISAKQVLKELICKGLVNTNMDGRKRYYWLSEKGMRIVEIL